LHRFTRKCAKRKGTNKPKSESYDEQLGWFMFDDDGNPTGKTEEDYLASKEFARAVEAFAEDLADPNYGQDYDDFDHEPDTPNWFV
jgi:hypothetical protein